MSPRLGRGSNGSWCLRRLGLELAAGGVKPANVDAEPHPGVDCLRTNVDDRDEETLWRTYATLTDVEAVFRTCGSN